MHWIQALIGPSSTLTDVCNRLPSAVVCALPQGLALIAITAPVEVELRESEFGPAPPVLPHSGEIGPGLAGLASQLSREGPIVYVATYIHGGTGGQDALVWVDGEVVLNIGDDEDNKSPWPDSPISRALRHIGVAATDGEDEFDALGLGRYRSNESWAEAHS